MPSSIEENLERWLRQQLFRERTKPLEKFVLRHAAQGSKGHEVCDFPPTSVDNLPLLRDEILARAQEDADSMGSKAQRYFVWALEEGAKTGPRHAFRMQGEGEDDEGEGGEEPPTEKGLTMQLMRHNEALMRMLVMTTGSSVQHLQRQLEKASDTISELTQARNEDRKMLEVAESNQHERDMQMLLTSGQEERKAALFKQVEALIPVVVRKVAGQPLLTDKEVSILKPFVDSLTAEQAQAIAAQLQPQQQIALMQAFKYIKDLGNKEGGNSNGVS